MLSKKTGLLCLLAIIGLKSFSQNSAASKPNIVLILADDLGWKDLGFMGSSYYRTPNLDALSKQSLIFTQGYAAAANCAPSRACLFSGLNTPRHGVYTVGTSERGDKVSRKLIPTPSTDILPDSVFTLAEALKKAGYTTAIMGKWHIGADPKTQGFDINVGGSHQGNAKSYFPPYGNPALKDGPAGEYITDRLGNEAVSFLNKQSGTKPFFLYLPFFAVHTPLQAPADLKNHYSANATGQSNVTYAAMIESLDANIGRILRKLDSMNLSKNTIVIFTSDNGGIRSISTQDPLRAGKGSYYEGGIRVPLTVRWPGIVKPGSTTAIPVTNMDFYPTLLDIAAYHPKNLKLDGNSILPVLKGGTLAPRTLYWHFPIYLQAYDPKKDDGRDPVFRTRPGAVVRDGDWKLHAYYEDNAQELYNLKSDPGERKNVVKQNPEIAKKLYQKLLAWQGATKAPVPTKLNPDFKASMQFVPEVKKKGKKDADE